MNDLFELTTRPVFGARTYEASPHDVRLGEFVRHDPEHYAESDIVILGYPHDEATRPTRGRAGAELAPDAIRSEFRALTTFGIHHRIFDLGNTRIGPTIDETHETHRMIVERLLADGKRVIVVGGAGDISYADGKAVANAVGADRWIAINVDARLDAADDSPRHNQTQFRQLIEEGLLEPRYFYELGFQPYFCPPAQFRFLNERGVKLISLEHMRSRVKADTEVREQIQHEFINHSRTMSVFFSFDLQSVRASDAPGVTELSPFGLRAGEFFVLVEYASRLVNTKVVEFTEVNPNFDIDGRTAKLVAIAMHKFCSATA